MEVTPSCALFKRAPQVSTFGVPPSEPHIDELQRCLVGPPKVPLPAKELQGLGRHDQILLPNEAIRPDARCPGPQCKITDDLLTKGFDIAAWMGQVTNFLSHLVLAVSRSLQAAGAAAQGQAGSGPGQVRGKVWPAQSPLSETCR